jgi:hypothetical protein
MLDSTSSNGRTAKRLSALITLCLATACQTFCADNSPQQDASQESVAKTEAGPEVEQQVEIPRSTFVVPASSAEGRDPFFPTLRDRITAASTGEKQTSAKPAVDRLALQGISGAGDRRLCVINDRTLAVGDEQEIPIPGGMLRVKCLEINETFVVIDLAGSRHELHFKTLK